MITMPTKRQVSQALNAAHVEQMRRRGSHGVLAYGLTHKQARQWMRLIKIATVLTQFKVQPSRALSIVVEAEQESGSMIACTMWAFEQLTDELREKPEPVSQDEIDAANAEDEDEEHGEPAT